MNHQKKWVGIFAAIFSIAFFAYLFLWNDAPYLSGDTGGYVEITEDLADFHLDTFHLRAPGYPWFMRLTGTVFEPTRMLFVAQLVMYLIMLAFQARLLWYFGVGKIWTLIWVFYCLLPVQVMPASRALTETLTQFLLVLGIGLIVRWFEKPRKVWLLALASALIVYAGITRPIYQYLGLGIGICLLFVLFIKVTVYPKKQIVFAALVIGILSSAGMGAIFLRNQALYGYLGITPLTGLHLTHKTARVLEQMPADMEPLRSILIHYRDLSLLDAGNNHQFYNFIWKIPMAELNQNGTIPWQELNRQLTKANLQLIINSPLIYLQEVGYSLINQFLPVNNAISDFGSSVLEGLWDILHFTVMGMFVVACSQIIAAGLFWLLIGPSRQTVIFRGMNQKISSGILWACLAGFVIIYTVGLNAAIEMGDPRTRLPVEPLILAVTVYVASNVWKLRSWFKNRPAGGSGL